MKGELAKVPEQNESNLKERVVNLSNKLNFGNSGDRSVATIALLATLVAATIVLILWTSAKNYVPLYGNQESYDKANIFNSLRHRGFYSSGCKRNTCIRQLFLRNQNITAIGINAKRDLLFIYNF